MVDDGDHEIDLVGPARRGLAMGLNEAAGYGALALTAFATGLIAERWGLRPAPFLLGLAYVGLGLGLSAILVRETKGSLARSATRSRSSACRISSPWQSAGSTRGGRCLQRNGGRARARRS